MLDDGRFLGVPIASPDGAPYWPAHNRLWERVLTFSLRAGHDAVFCCPLQPAELRLPAPWAMLDCSDAELRRRLRARGWTAEARIEEAVADAVDCRAAITTRFDTESSSPDAVAAAIAAWARP
ncbi:hypothetical protein [Jiangella gansuensis]|uniref:hypothetical protein n=1 Tax=Jiangella gansuensis TaxID=281473 RepID=UPI000686652F|nr:hypothetical protein [Jiangella gansuensis]